MLMNSLTLREKFFAYFTAQKHMQVDSSPLIPADDPTLLFTNAGMNQFKDVFLGKEKRNYTRAVSIQKCIRAGGKHNDLENVGFTRRHLTFFEMMGNFSFGDYFKKDAIIFAWDFLTKECGLPKDKLYATVFEKDDEAYELWQTAVGLPKERIRRLGASDNFWQMAATGPCGPCSEIYIDKGENLGCGKKECGPGCSCDRFMEIWNLVFMQFDRQEDGTDVPLKQTGVDTGMGLERLCTVLQNTESVFETDLFTPIIHKIEKITGISYANSSETTRAAFRVLADHIRSTSLALADGGVPSNEGRGYVIRKIIRRAALFSQKLSTKNFFADLVPAVVESLGDIYPDLKNRQDFITSVLRSETEKFSQNLVNGKKMLADYLEKNQSTKIISGSTAFKLYDTYGFPLELTKVIAQEHEFAIDLVGFDQEMERQRMQSGKKETAQTAPTSHEAQTEFTGYRELETTSRITGFLVNNAPMQSVTPDQDCFVITEKSPLYVECGGQINDTASLTAHGKSTPIKDIKKVGNAIAAHIIAPAALSLGDEVTITVDRAARRATMKNHTATHLLQTALMQVLGKQVKQAGSLVAPDYLRFDFTYHENPTPEQIAQIEKIVNDIVHENIPVKISETSYKEATDRGVIAFFGEKYNPEKVRVVEVPGISAELCGGTHVAATGEIGCFKITEISSLGSGTRRIVAITGPKACELFQHAFSTVKDIAQTFNVPVLKTREAFEKQREQLKHAQAQLKATRKQLLKTLMPQWIAQAQKAGALSIVFEASTDIMPDEPRELVQELLGHISGIVMIVSTAHDKISFAAAVSKNLPFSTKDFGTFLKSQGFSGGGDPIIQGGAQKIPENFAKSLEEWALAHKQ